MSCCPFINPAARLMSEKSLERFRSFIAIPLPTTLQQEIVSLQQQLSQAIPSLKPVAIHNLHLTLQFLGERIEDQLAEIGRIMLSIARKKNYFNVILAGLGSFPNRSRPKILWIGLEPSTELLELQNNLTELLEQKGLQPDLRPYRPHLTIGRFKTSLPQPEALCPFLSQQQRILKVDRIILYTSRLTATGAIHSPHQIVRFK